MACASANGDVHKYVRLRTAAAQLFPALSRAGNKDYHGLNSVRLAEVWLDDYKRLFYMHRHDLLVSLLYSYSYSYSYSALYTFIASRGRERQHIRCTSTSTGNCP